MRRSVPPAAPRREQAFVGDDQSGHLRAAVFLRHYIGAQGSDRADRLRPRTGEAATGSQCRGSRAFPGSGHRTAQRCRANHRLCRGSKGQRSRASEGQLDRQQADVDPRRDGQGRQANMPCCRRVSLIFFAPIGGERDQASGCSPARSQARM